MKPENALSRLQELKLLKNNWYSVAKTVSQVIEENHWLPGQVATNRWLAQVKATMGLTGNTIGRMLAVREFLDELAGDRGPRKWGDPDTFPMSSLEILKRIHAIDRQRALALLETALKGETRLRQLRSELALLASGDNQARTSSRALTKRAGAAFKKQVMKSFDQWPEDYGCAAYVSWGPLAVSPFPYFFQVDSVALDTKSQSVPDTLIAIDVYADARTSEQVRKTLGQRLAQICYRSSFVSRYFAIFPIELDREVLAPLLKTLDALGIRNVAIVTADLSSSSRRPKVAFLRAPTPGAGPTPDRRHLMPWDQITTSWQANPTN